QVGQPAPRGIVHVKGTHAAVDRYTEFSRKNRYVLKCDLRKFFPSLDHEILLSILARKIGCRRTLDLLRLIVESSNPQEPMAAYFPGDNLFTPHERRRGLPIGNLTSQFFANVYLNPFDHFVKEELGCRFYIRYCDDFVIFENDKRALGRLVERLADRLSAVRLRLHERKCQVRRVDEGVDFLGYRIWPTHRRLRRDSVLRFKRRRRHLRDARRAGDTDLAHVRASVASWMGHAQHADTWQLRRTLETFAW
ncbi:MAG: RNA-directed DNA polymerase, partial [Armatimonadetes bacterium]|nr:RNA-directed DNA polymerase [Armatimonadota bacterium]